MRYKNNNTNNSKGKHLKYEDRVKIEALLKEKLTTKEIALHLGKSQRTIQRET